MPHMLAYVVRRLMLGLVTLFGVAVIVFFLMRVLPGDAAVMLSGADAGAVAEEELAEVRAKLGLDRPLAVQFADWAGHVAMLELGTSLRTGNPVIVDVARHFPYTLQIVVMAMLLLALAMAAVLGPSLPNVIVALAMPIVPRAARIARSSVLVLKAATFIEAARATGCSDLRIMLRHVLPNTFAPLLVIATAYLGLAIVQEAALDYLGAGIQEPDSSWGLMMSGSATSLALTAPWIVIFPGLAIFLTVLASNLLGDAIRDLLDPKLRGK